MTDPEIGALWAKRNETREPYLIAELIIKIVEVRVEFDGESPTYVLKAFGIDLADYEAYLKIREATKDQP